MKRFISVFVAIVVMSEAFSQVGGGSAAYGQQRQSGSEAARAAELAKRTFARDDSAQFIDAAVLMNVPADEYVAVFGINEEGKTLDEARQKMEASVRTFTAGLQQLRVPASNYYVDFVAQNRIYGYDVNGDFAKEVVVGFEVKKNVSIRYTDKTLIDRLTAAASRAGVFDLIKVDYVVKNVAAIHSRLLDEASQIIKQKSQEQERLLGVKIGQILQAYPAQFSAYFPTEMYDSYVAQEAEDLLGYRPNQFVQRARKPKTFFFNGLTAKDFDRVIDPVITEPMVQFTVYVRVRY